MQNRFVTYMYTYINGRKEKNVGFSKVCINNEQIKMETHIKNIGKYSGTVKTFAIAENNKISSSTNTNKNTNENTNENTNKSTNESTNKSIKTKDLEIIEIGNLTITNGSAVGNFNIPLKNIIGIRIEIEENFFIASCWKEESANVISSLSNVTPRARQEARTRKELSPRQELSSSLIENSNQNLANNEGIYKENIYKENIYKENIYKKITIDEIKKLPQKNWHYRSNRFLLHSYSNYKYLIIKNQSLGHKAKQNTSQEVDTSKILSNYERYYIGVPGIYSQYLNNLASMFGFNYFEIHESDETEKENPQENPEGKFGYWLSEIDMLP